MESGTNLMYLQLKKFINVVVSNHSLPSVYRMNSETSAFNSTSVCHALLCLGPSLLVNPQCWNRSSVLTSCQEVTVQSPDVPLSFVSTTSREIYRRMQFSPMKFLEENSQTSKKFRTTSLGLRTKFAETIKTLLTSQLCSKCTPTPVPILLLSICPESPVSPSLASPTTSKKLHVQWHTGT